MVADQFLSTRKVSTKGKKSQNSSLLRLIHLSIILSAYQGCDPHDNSDRHTKGYLSEQAEQSGLPTLKSRSFQIVERAKTTLYNVDAVLTQRINEVMQQRDEEVE